MTDRFDLVARALISLRKVCRMCIAREEKKKIQAHARRAILRYSLTCWRADANMKLKGKKKKTINDYMNSFVYYPLYRSTRLGGGSSSMMLGLFSRCRRSVVRLSDKNV